jgi:hypothetical protein
LSIKISATAPDGFLAFSHAGDDWKTCRDYVKERLGLSTGPQKHQEQQPPPKPNPKPPTDLDNRAVALQRWHEGVNPRGTPVETYLRSRGLELDEWTAGQVLRWQPRAGAMLALFRNIETDEPQAISRTFLDAKACKIDRRFLGPVGGCAIKLDPDREVTHGLHIGEGVESCMSARQFGLKPCWALGSKGAISAFPVLAGIQCLTILAEPDAERETEQCAYRWYGAGREVFINRSVIGTDLNDALMGVAR